MDRLGFETHAGSGGGEGKHPISAVEIPKLNSCPFEQPKLWTELQAGIECLTQLLLLIDTMSSSDIADPELSEAADVLQQQLIYNGEVLDIAFESLRSYKEGTQSLAYLDSSVYMAYALLRMLERWGKSKGGDMYVRKKKSKRRKPKGCPISLIFASSIFTGMGQVKLLAKTTVTWTPAMTAKRVER